MKKRIFCSMVALVGSAMALCFIFITGLLYEHYSNLQTEHLKETASYIKQGYEAADNPIWKRYILGRIG